MAPGEEGWAAATGWDLVAAADKGWAAEEGSGSAEVVDWGSAAAADWGWAVEEVVAVGWVVCCRLLLSSQPHRRKTMRCH